MAQQLAVALRYLREHGVSHLDLKPSNLLVSGSQPPLLKVADFGFAQHLEENATERGLRGSPLYMAPEILSGAGHSVAVDWWSLGILTYQMIFGLINYFCFFIDYLNSYLCMFFNKTIGFAVEFPIHFSHEISKNI